MILGKIFLNHFKLATYTTVLSETRSPGVILLHAGVHTSDYNAPGLIFNFHAGHSKNDEQFTSVSLYNLDWFPTSLVWCLSFTLMQTLLNTASNNERFASVSLYNADRFSTSLVWCLSFTLVIYVASSSMLGAEISSTLPLQCWAPNSKMMVFSHARAGTDWSL